MNCMEAYLTTLTSSSARQQQQPVPSELPVNNKRQEGWEALNHILVKKKKAKKRRDGKPRPYSSVTCAEVGDVYEPITEKYNLATKSVPDEAMSSLLSQLTKAGRIFGPLITGDPATRLHFIAPMLVSLCDLLDGDTEILVEKAIEGKKIDVNGHFGFFLKCKKKRICIVLARRQDFDQGCVQALLGCEAVADMERLECVYGIVTDYCRWVFIKSLDDTIEQSISFLALGTDQVPERGSLEMIAGMIYAMLSE